MKKKSTPAPNLVAEVVIIAVKFFFLFLVINNIVWGMLYFKKPSVSINQSENHDIVQEING